MIDNVAIYLSCSALVYIIWRAALLDNLHPWYRPFRDESRRLTEAEEEQRQQRGQSQLPVWRR